MIRVKGVFPNGKGYLICRLSNNKLIPLHRYIWIQHFGKIPKGCEIHHKDENPLNNKITNLCLVTIINHRKHHIRRRKQKKKNKGKGKK